MNKLKFWAVGLVFLALGLQAQTVTNIEVKPVGEYADIKIADQNRMMKQLYDTQTRNASVDTIFNNITHYNPPVLYVFSQALFANGEKVPAVEWYLYAQINAMYDAERCADGSAKQAVLILEENIRATVGSYMRQTPGLEKESAEKVLVLFRKLAPDYDIRWINLHGMGAFSGAFGEETPNEKPKLTEDTIRWPAMREKVLNEFAKMHGVKLK